MPKIKKSLDPHEERVITWRHPGMLHNKLLEERKKLGISMNQLITKAVTAFFKPEPPPKPQTPPDENEDQSFEL